MIKIKNVNGMFWNAENNCWTVAECAATIYSSKNELPDRMGSQGELVGCFTADFDVIYYDGYGDDAAGIASLAASCIKTLNLAHYGGPASVFYAKRRKQHEKFNGNETKMWLEWM